MNIEIKEPVETEAGITIGTTLFERPGVPHEDHCCCITPLNSKEIQTAWILFDGHSGAFHQFLREDVHHQLVSTYFYIPFVFIDMIEEAYYPDLNMKHAINTASNNMNRYLIDKEDALLFGLCVQCVLRTKDGLYVAKLGDGDEIVFSDKYKNPYRLNLKKHIPHRDRRKRNAAGLNVTGTWGDKWGRDISFGEKLHADPDVVFIPWKDIREHGISRMILTTDGLYNLQWAMQILATKEGKAELDRNDHKRIRESFPNNPNDYIIWKYLAREGLTKEFVNFIENALFLWEKHLDFFMEQEFGPPDDITIAQLEFDY